MCERISTPPIQVLVTLKITNEKRRKHVYIERMCHVVYSRMCVTFVLVLLYADRRFIIHGNSKNFFTSENVINGKYASIKLLQNCNFFVTIATSMFHKITKNTRS